MKKLLFTILLLFSVNTYAAGVWYYGLTVKSVRAQNKANQTGFTTVEAINNPAACPHSHYYGIRPENNPQLAMSVLLTAFTSNKKVDIFVQSDECDVFNRPSVGDVRITN